MFIKRNDLSIWAVEGKFDKDRKMRSSNFQPYWKLRETNQNLKVWDLLLSKKIYTLLAFWSNTMLDLSAKLPFRLPNFSIAFTFVLWFFFFSSSFSSCKVLACTKFMECIYEQNIIIICVHLHFMSREV